VDRWLAENPSSDSAAAAAEGSRHQNNNNTSEQKAPPDVSKSHASSAVSATSRDGQDGQSETVDRVADEAEVTIEYCHYSVHVPYGRGWVLLWRRCDTLCTSGFVYDATWALWRHVATAAATSLQW